MQVIVDDSVLKPFSKYKEIAALIGYRGGSTIRLDLITLNDKIVEEIRVALVAKKGQRALLGASTIKLYQDTMKNPKNVTPRNLQHLVAAIRGYVNQSPNLFLFEQNTYDDQWMPYVVTDITYTAYNRRDQEEAFVSMSLAYYEKGKVHTASHTFRAGHVQGTTAEILRAVGYVLENDEIMMEYQAGVAQFNKFATAVGTQVIGRNYAQEQDGGYYSSGGRVALEVDGVATRLVIDGTPDRADDDHEETASQRSGGRELPTVSARYWGRSNFDEDAKTRKLGNAASEDDEQDDEEVENEDIEQEQAGKVKLLRVPLHPYVLCFDLRRHIFVYVHTNNLDPYKYDKKVAEKLVLPEESKELISILVENASGHFEDIIKGKAGGSIIMCAGEPGTGKTLTAEVYSEVMERPLYTVQCSQLGLDLETLEKTLKKVLARAMRWKAILLLDEADVYIHMRGADVQQNAIVGIFLRVLEYYNGVLFMTTNRPDDIDDAIASRATARLTYKKPSLADQEALWAILAPGAGLKLTPAVVKAIVKAHSDLSGRDIKNLVKLASLVAKKRGKTVDVDMVTYVRKFKQ